MPTTRSRARALLTEVDKVVARLSPNTHARTVRGVMRAQQKVRAVQSAKRAKKRTKSRRSARKPTRKSDKASKKHAAQLARAEKDVVKLKQDIAKAEEKIYGLRSPTWRSRNISPEVLDDLTQERIAEEIRDWEEVVRKDTAKLERRERRVADLKSKRV